MHFTDFHNKPGLNFLLLFCVLYSFSFSKEPTVDFPLSKGTYWVYLGKVNWMDIHDSEAILSTTVRIKMEVLETVQKNNLFAAVIQDYPGILDWSEGTTFHRKSLILCVNSTQYYQFPESQIDSILTLLKEGILDVTKKPYINFLELDFPLKKGKTYAYDDNLREDRHYCWLVENMQSMYLRNIHGVSPKEKRIQYRLSYRTLPDHMFIDFVPGIGITRYIYSHHGSVADTNAQLIEFHEEK